MTSTLEVCSVPVVGKAGAALRRRVNVILPDRTLELMDRIVPRGGRSRFIDEAIRHLVLTVGLARIRRKLLEGGRRRAERDLAIAEDWFERDDGSTSDPHSSSIRGAQ